MIRKLSITIMKSRDILQTVRDKKHIGFDDEHILAATQWLLYSQEVWGNRGYAHSYHLLHGWQQPYPETTGYIIPSLHKVYLRYGIPEVRDSIALAAKWLYSVQDASGCFNDLQGHPQVFDTGQILIGFNYLSEHLPELADTGRLRAAAEWLCKVQEKDGSFIAHAYHEIPHTYYSRVGAAMVKAGRILDDERIIRAGLANLDWTVRQQEGNGFFRHLGFDNSPPFLHTMVYAMEGLLDAHELTGRFDYLEATTRFTDRLLDISRGRDLILRSQYDKNFSVFNGEKCMTGLTQWAGVCFRLARILGKEEYRSEGMKTVYYLKSKQIFCRDRRLHGGLPGSNPLHGRYITMAIPNWSQKFFIDTLLMKLDWMPHTSA